MLLTQLVQENQMKKKRNRKYSKADILAKLREHGLSVDRVRNRDGFRVWLVSDGTIANSLNELAYIYRRLFEDD